ncbi:MAG: YraN family protein, partial [Acutalibacteraceae bacterium]
IDLIAVKKKIIAFIEVKTRKPDSLGLPREAVNKMKQRKIIMAAMLFMQNKKFQNFQPRFDVIEVIMDYDTEFRKAHINHIENAFSAEGIDASF